MQVRNWPRAGGIRAYGSAAAPALIALVLFVVPAKFASAQEKAENKVSNEDENSKRLEIINFCIFAGAFGWFIYKKAPAFYNARSADIQKAIKDATGLKLEADYRYSELDRKMATLGEEVKRIRDKAAADMEREHERMRHETEQEIEHLHRNVRFEIEALRKEGTRKIRAAAIQQAAQLTEQRLGYQFARGGVQDDFVRDFVHAVERGKN